MTEQTILAIIQAKGVFQLNPLAYRNEKKVKLLKQMIKKGLIVRQRVSPGVSNYVLPQ